MQNQQEDTFVFGQSVKGFLKRYQADAKFAQEARKKAKGVLDGNVRLICPEDIRPLALRLFRRLVNSEMVLFSFYSSAGKDADRRSRKQMIRREFGDRLRNNANFAKFVMYEVAPAAACGRLDLRCKSEHRRVVKELLQELWVMAVAGRVDSALSVAGFYLAAYLFMNLGAFVVTAQLEQLTGSDRVEGLRGLGQRAPFAAAVFALSLLSLAGIPPLAGFVGKVLLLEATLSGGLTWLAVVAVVNMAISLYY